MGKRGNRERKLLPFQSNAPTGANEQFSIITRSLRKSPAWHALTRGQRGLYVELTGCMRWDSNGEAPKGTPRHDYPDRLDFAKPWIIYYSQAMAKASGAYNNYATGAFNTHAFREDMAMLQALGFIDLLRAGKNTRTANVYQLSERWKKYTPEDVHQIMEQLQARKKERLQKTRERKRLSDTRKRLLEAEPPTQRGAFQ